MSRPRVAHLIRTWVAPSETFIVGQVQGSTRTQPVVVARKERSGARELLAAIAPPPGEKSALLLTGEGLSPLARTVADLAWRARLLTDREGAGMAARLRAAGVALLHAHFGTDAAFFAPLWRRLALPRVASFYGYDAWKTGRRAFGLGRRYLARVFTGFDALLVPSQDMHDDLVALGAPAAKLRKLPWGINLARFAPSAAAGTAAGSAVASNAGAPLRLISVCRFIAKKGLCDALAAFAQLCRAGVAAEYRLVGEGPLAAALTAQARALGIAERVQFTGFIAPERLPALLRRHDLFLQPSVTAADGDKEGVPTAILEAAACELPVVATRHGGIPEAVQDGATGVLVPEHDVATLAAALQGLAHDAARRRALGAAGRAHVAARFDLARQNERREELYAELLARRPAAADSEAR